MKKAILYISAIFTIVFTHACQVSRGCDATESLVKMGFYTDEPETAVSVENVSVYGVGREDSLLYELQTIGTVLLPLSPAEESSAFVFEYGNLKDTITFFYQTNTRFESQDCGFMADYRIDNFDYTKNAIDSIAQVTNEITNENEEHYKIFFK